MEALKEWLEYRLAQNKVEPASVVGSAYNYMLKHWQGLTQFLWVANAPLDNNQAEVRFVGRKLNANGSRDRPSSYNNGLRTPVKCW